MNDYDVRFGFEGATSQDGPFGQLLVRHVAGGEQIGRGYRYQLDVLLPHDAPGLEPEDLIDCWGSLWLRTHLATPWRVKHGVISEVVRQARTPYGQRFRVVLSPPTLRAIDLTKCVVHVERTLEEILLLTLGRTARGMALAPSERDDAAPSSEERPDFSRYFAPRATYVLRLRDTDRVRDREAYGYCVQYEEDDVAFLSRLAETEGIGIHFEHSAQEVTLVLADSDEGRPLRADVHLAPNALHQTLRSFERGRRVRPSGTMLLDHDYRRPDYPLAAIPPRGIDARTAFAFSRGFERAEDEGQGLALARAQRFACERGFASATTNCRGLSAGERVFIDEGDGAAPIEHLVVSTTVDIAQRLSFETEAAADHAHVTLELTRACPADATSVETRFRPARETPKPRVRGTQTATVVAEPETKTEINVGGAGDFGSVRVQFPWDIAIDRRRGEPSSCWIRVSQVFAGPSHGAMFHPRVGDEVIIDYLDGDPDRPIIVGRVYNGKNLSPENATLRPTFSCLKSMSSPRDGNYNMLAFEDAQGSEELILHAARNLVIHARNDAFRQVNNDHIKVDGDQVVEIEGGRGTHVAREDKTVSDTKISFQAPEVVAEGTGFLTLEGGLTLVIGRAQLVLKGAIVNVQGGAIHMSADGVLSLASGGVTNITSSGDVNVTAANVNLNC